MCYLRRCCQAFAVRSKRSSTKSFRLHSPAIRLVSGEQKLRLWIETIACRWRLQIEHPHYVASSQVASLLLSETPAASLRDRRTRKDLSREDAKTAQSKKAA